MIDNATRGDYSGASVIAQTHGHVVAGHAHDVGRRNVTAGQRDRRVTQRKRRAANSIAEWIDAY